MTNMEAFANRGWSSSSAPLDDELDSKLCPQTAAAARQASCKEAKLCKSGGLGDAGWWGTRNHPNVAKWTNTRHTCGACNTDQSKWAQNSDQFIKQPQLVHEKQPQPSGNSSIHCPFLELCYLCSCVPFGPFKNVPKWACQFTSSCTVFHDCPAVNSPSNRRSTILRWFICLLTILNLSAIRE